MKAFTVESNSAHTHYPAGSMEEGRCETLWAGGNTLVKRKLNDNVQTGVTECLERHEPSLGPASLFAASVPHFHFPGCTAELRSCKLCFESCWVLPTKCVQEWRILHTRSADVLYYVYHLSVGSDKLNATATHITQIPSKNQFLALHDCSF